MSKIPTLSCRKRETKVVNPIHIMKLKFRWLLDGPYAIVRFAHDAAVPEWATKGEFISISRSTDELSIVCPAENLPRDVDTQHHWQCFKLQGPFPFSMTGALLSFISSYLGLGFILFLQINFALAPPVLSIPHWAERLVQRWRG